MHRSPLIAALALAGCGTAEGSGGHFTMDTLPSGTVVVASDAPDRWRAEPATLERIGTFGGEEGTDAALTDPQTLAVDGAGRVYVADQKPTTIKVFGPDGKLIRTIGREGEGPGEFNVAFIAVWKDRLVVHDPRNSRTSVFDTAGTYLTSWRSSCCYWTPIQIDTAGRVYIPTADFAREPDAPRRGQPWTRYRLDGSLIDTLWVPRRNPAEAKMWTLRGGSGRNQMMRMMSVPFTPNMHTALDPFGGFVVGWSGGFEMAVSPTGRDTTLLIRRVWQAGTIPDPMRRAEVEEQIERVGDQFDPAVLRETFKLEEIPTVAPAYMGLDVDRDGNVWARQLLASDSTKTTWEVFDRRGVWLGAVSAPVELETSGARYFGKGEVYFAAEDDVGRPVVVHFRLAP